MNAVSLARALLCAGLACGNAGAALAQQGIRHEPDTWRGSGLRLDAAPNWGARFELLRPGHYELEPRYSLLGATAEPAWHGAGYRLRWSYELGPRGSFGLSLASGRDAEDFIGRELPAGRRLSLYGRYWFAPDWAVSAEALAPTESPLRRPSIRFGVQRQF